MAKSIRAILAGYTLPGGYTAELAGGYAEMMENFSDLGLALIVSVGLVYFVLASQFESFVMPVIIMMILPIAFAGALFALPLTGKDLSMISLVSLIMLAGTVVNASIVLVDYIKQRRDRGETREEAILHACPLRIRPVLMTTLTTILALVPTALGMTGKMNEMMSDMGTTMIAGMLVSTVITLLFTPVYYCVIDDLTHRRERRKAKKLAAEKGIDVAEDAGRGWRQVVASPRPKEIVEIATVKALMNAKHAVIAAGGGGIPVVWEDKYHLKGVPAVIDKDFASECMAEQLDADMLIILTAVEKVAINFGKPDQKGLDTLTPDEARKYIDEKQFAPGSMLPKVQAAMSFAESKPGRVALITLLEKAAEGIEGKTGTRVQM